MTEKMASSKSNENICMSDSGGAFPLVDLSGHIDQVAIELRSALSTTGFVYCVNHEKDFEIQEGFKALRSFFKQSLESKNKATSINRALRGYSPAHSENFASLYGVRAPNDCVEKFRIGPLGGDNVDRPRSQKTFYFENTWPPKNISGKDITYSEVIENCSKNGSTSSVRTGDHETINDTTKTEFQQCMERMYVAMSRIADKVALALAIALELPPDYFKAQMKHPTSILSGNYYPASSRNTAAAAGQSNPSCHTAAHTDVSLFTIVCQDDHGQLNPHFTNNQKIEYSGGLEVKLGDGCNEGDVDTGGEWARATPLPNTVVINIGDCLADWSGGRLKSTVHRVTPLRRTVTTLSPTIRTNSDEGDVIEEGEASAPIHVEPCERLSFAFFCTPDPETNVHPSTMRVATQMNTTTTDDGNWTLKGDLEQSQPDHHQDTLSDITCVSSSPFEVLLYSKWRKDRVQRSMSILKKTSSD